MVTEETKTKSPTDRQADRKIYRQTDRQKDGDIKTDKKIGG